MDLIFAFTSLFVGLKSILVQHFPCPIPVTLQEDVKIKELQQKDIIAKTLKIRSMVMVAKPGKIRICLDPKALNRAVQHPKH